MSVVVDGSVLEARVRVMLPDLYSDSYERVAPVPMRSAGLKYRDGRVAWDEIWGSFCDLAMAGGPPHRGRLLEPATEDEVAAARDKYRDVVEEISRGIRLVTGLYAEASPVPGWVQMYCPSAAMADWLARAITMENVAAHRKGLVLNLPAGPAFRLEKEIKNVVTSVAKTTHYWMEHTAEDRREAIAKLFAEMNAEAALVQPALRLPKDPMLLKTSTETAIAAATGLDTAPHTYAAWAGLACASIPMAIAMMRLLVVSNVLARREDTAVFVPLPTEGIAQTESLPALFQNACQHAVAQLARSPR